MKDYKGIIYDIDGTILNTLDMNMYPLIEIIKEETGNVLTFEEVLKYAPYPGMKVMELLDVKDKEKTYARWVKYVNEYEFGATLYSDFREVFESFKKARKIQAVVSAKTKAQYEIDMVEKNLHQYMEATVLAEDTQKHKPDPAPLNLCLEKINLKKEEVIYIGDALSDYEAAKAAGMDFGYAKWGNFTNLDLPDATFTFQKPIDLLQLIIK